MKTLISSLTREKWERLFSGLKEFQSETENFIDRFGHRVRTKDQVLLLDIADKIKQIYQIPEMFIDILHLPDEQIPPIRYRPGHETKEVLHDHIAQNISELISLIIPLLRKNVNVH